MPKIISRGDTIIPQQESKIQTNIETLKDFLSKESLNEAVRRYHAIIKTMNDINFQVNLENEEFYKTIFYQTLLEQKIYNIKGLL